MKRRRYRSRTIAAASAGYADSSGLPWFSRLVVGVLILAAVVALFGYVGLWGLSGGWFEGVDRFAIDADPDALLTRVFVVVTWFGTLEGTIIITTAMFFFLLWKRAFRGAIALLGSALSAAYVNDFIKDWVGRPRPEHLGIVEAGGFSYLSGHAYVGTAIYGIFAYLMVRRAQRLWAKWAIGIFAAAAIGLIGFSRIYLNVHYTSDVIAGFLLGIVWMAGWLAIFRPYAARPRR